jgi:capsular polysaccharide biosynthesis protein
MTSAKQSENTTVSEAATQGRRPSSLEGARARVDFWPAIRRHWLLAVLPMIVLVGLAVAAAYARDPVYTAQTRLSVGRLDASAPEALAGFTGASSALAETYSRSIRGDAIVAEVARKSGLSRGFVKSTLSATSIPETPVFTVFGKTGSPRTAVQLSVLASRALKQQTAQAGRSTPNADRILRDYQRASKAKAEAELAVSSARSAYRDERTANNQQWLVDSEAALAKVQAQVEAARAAYVSGRQGQGSVSLINVIERATTASSDRDNVLQLWGFGAAITGIAIGFALAYWRARALARRAAA